MLGGQIEMTEILYVDDEKISAKYFKYRFKSLYKILVAYNINEAYSVLNSKENNIKIIVTDLHMPDKLDGLLLLKFVLEKYPNISRIIHTGNDTYKDYKLKSDDPFEYILPKPLEKNVALKMFEESLKKCKKD